MGNGWDEYADDWDDQIGTRSYAQAAFGSLVAILDGTSIDLQAARVVDFGCGTGLLTGYLVDAGATVVAVDTSPKMLEALQAKAASRSWTTVTMTAEIDEVQQGNDVIVCSSVCSFLDDYPATAARLASLLRPGGLFVQWESERAADDDHGLTRSEIVDALNAAGLDEVEARTAFQVEVEGQTMQPLLGLGRRPQ